MTVLCVGQMEDDTYIRQQIAKQTRQPDYIEFYIDREPAVGIDARRRRIADNHQKLVGIVEKYPDVDLIWQVESDAELPEFALALLIEDYQQYKSERFGYITGVQVGRHGLYCLGAWHVAHDKQSFRSVDYKKGGIKRLDANGFYCLLSPRDVWLKGVAYWNGHVWGPDVNWCLSLKGYEKYVDMDLEIGHNTKRGVIRPSDPSTCNAEFRFDGIQWKYKQTD